MGDYLLPIPFGDGLIPVQLSAGYETTCVVFANHGLQCWGSSDRGQVGQGNTNDVLIPTAVSLGDGFDVLFVSVGGHSVCAVSITNELKWFVVLGLIKLNSAFLSFFQLGSKHIWAARPRTQRRHW